MRRQYEQHGGAALEYLIVSACALLMGLAAAGFVGKIFHEKLKHLSDSVEEKWDQNWTDWQDD